MKKKKMKLQKFAYGGNYGYAPWDQALIDRINGQPAYMDSPDNALARADIREAKVMEQANNNPWVTGLNVAGGVLGAVGGSLMNTAMANPTGALDSKIAGSAVGKTAANMGSGLFPMFTTAIPFMAHGGMVGGMAPVEVEGQEMAEMPNGQMMQFEGPSHEGGGIPVNLPVGTEIFSKRIKIDNKTMAQRKKDRENTEAILQKKLDKDPDAILKNSLERVQSINAVEDQKDKSIQAILSGGQVPNMQEQPMMQQPMPKMADGGPVRKPLNFTVNPLPYNPALDVNGNYIYPVPGLDKEYRKYSAYEAVAPGYAQNALTKSSEAYLPEAMNIAQAQVNSQETSPSTKWPDLIGQGLTPGDLLGLAGNIYQGVKTRQNVLRNRAGDMPNVNSFTNYGKRSLETLDKNKEYVNQQRDLANREIDRQMQTAMATARGSAQSANTMRALDLAAYLGAQQAVNNNYSNATNAYTGINDKIAALQSDIDAKVMAGERERILANQADRDNFFNQLTQADQGIGRLISESGKFANQVKANNYRWKAMNELGGYIRRNPLTGNLEMRDDAGHFTPIQPNPKHTSPDTLSPEEIAAFRKWQSYMNSVEKSNK